MAEINKDLARWSRHKWFLIIGMVTGLQLGGLFLASNVVKARTVYPDLPTFAATQPNRSESVDAFEDPLLFATASWNGFSGAAWMRKNPNPDLFEETLPAARFWSYTDALHAFPPRLPERSHPVALDYHVTPRPLEVTFPEKPLVSTVAIEGDAATRGLLQKIDLPAQYHSDILESSVVQVLIDRDGMVVSARLLESSGSRKADQDAVALASKARFAPSTTDFDTASAPISFGKLIFNWIALTSPSTR
ncbi:MAG: energy transducer TonB [Verrucomicrobiota bacterium]